ncbi:MAG: DUF5131 family protein [Candidatus Binatia bacterium]|jgi:protein gp37
MGQRNYVKGFDLALHEDALEIPLRWRKPQMVFVNSMSDLFHEGVPLEFTLGPCLHPMLSQSVL